MTATQSVQYARYAPSPTGLLHLGNALAALICFEDAQRHNMPFLLRIEDIDQTRCRQHFEQAIYDDLRWLGLSWHDGDVRRQSDHMRDYASALETLKNRGLLYPCFCTRAQIQQEIADSNGAPHGPLGVFYPGTCRHLTKDEQQSRLATGDAHAWRLNLEKARDLVGDRILTWSDMRAGEVTMSLDNIGDPILGRKDSPVSYHLAVVLDDGLQQIGRVTRGEDLFHATHLHRLLQFLFDLPTPIYHHHHLLLDETGKRMAKRRGSATISHWRENRESRSALFAAIGYEPHGVI